MPPATDQLYSKKLAHIDGFRFDANVARVFADMITRSVPGYAQILALLPTLVRAINQSACNESGEQQHYYDLGCSLGAGLVAMTQGVGEPIESQRFIGVDNSPAMLDGARKSLDRLNLKHHFTLKNVDILELELKQATMVLMNFTLQFIPLSRRDPLIEKIFKALKPGGTLVLSEKISMSDAISNQCLTNIHHQYKADQGYSELEISQKRDAIENVLIPETLAHHEQRLKKAGFAIVTPWIQNLQFVSILAIK